MTDAKFIPAATVASVPEGDVIGVEVGGRKIALFKLDGMIYALEGYCTHGHAELAGGYVEGDRIQCPMHGGMFEIRTGKAVGDPCTVDLPVLPVRIEGDQVLVGLPGEGG
ncbi:MAG TPA: non-heme iron oxygenase ferredoxin subunit [Stellaceae bacterium]|nr:non-heme iron oxygenase ferredoxin subunit [Stellaceae bacterium]